MNQRPLLLPLRRGLLPQPLSDFFGYRSNSKAICRKKGWDGSTEGFCPFVPLSLLKFSALALLGESLERGRRRSVGSPLCSGVEEHKGCMQELWRWPLCLCWPWPPRVSPPLGRGCPCEDGQCHLQPLGWRLGRRWLCLNCLLSWLHVPDSSQRGVRGSAGGAAK